MTPLPPPVVSPEVFATLNRVRRQIRRYVFWEGLALVFALAGLLFWGSFLIDASYFTLSRLELPRWLRVAFLLLSLAALVGGILALLAFRLFRVMRGRALALLLERRFPDLGDGLITAVEAAEGDWQPQGQFENAMLARTIADASQKVQRLELRSLFDPRPLRRAAIAAAVLIVSVLGLAVVDSSAMERWVNGYWRLQPSYWPRETELKVYAVTQPDDQQREFVQGRYRHPRGGDLQLEIVSAEGKTVPDRVRLDYRLRGGSWKRTYLTTSGDQPFRQAFPALLDDVEFWVSGGDFATSTPWRVDVVEPPRLERMELSVRYPDYTQWNDGATEPEGRTLLPVLGSQISLPMGTLVQLIATSNKPILSARIEFDAGVERFEWSLTAGANGQQPQSRITVRAHDEAPERSVEWNPGAPLLSTDQQTIQLPLQLMPDGEQQLRAAISSADSAGKLTVAALPWPADTTVRIHLEDLDGIASPEPARLTINSIVDQPPALEVDLKGISPSITRQARIPLAGRIRDDYGLSNVHFEYQIDNAQDWKSQDLSRPPASGSRDFELARSDEQLFERFDVLPLDLSIKQRLILTVVAVDADNLYGPHTQRSQKFVFTIVPVEELLSLLYGRELNLRQRFEQILTELRDLEKDLNLHRDRALALPNEQGEARNQTVVALSACAERSLHAIRKNTAEVQSIEIAFGEIREELINNAAETPQNMERLEGKILAPLRRAIEEGFPAVDGALGLFGLANSENQSVLPPLEQARADLRNLITGLERVLLEMRKLETFHEAQELLKAIISDHDAVTEETKTQRKARALRALEE